MAAAETEREEAGAAAPVGVRLVLFGRIASRIALLRSLVLEVLPVFSWRTAALVLVLVVSVLVAAEVGVFSVGFAVPALGVVEVLRVTGVLRAVGVLRTVGVVRVASSFLLLSELLLAVAGEVGEVFAARATGGAGYAERRTVAGAADPPEVLPEMEGVLEPVLGAALELAIGGRG